MNELSYLNRFFLKYRGRLALGTLFIIISNLFAIIPAQVVRHSFDLIAESKDLYFSFENFGLQQTTLNIFTANILFYGLLIVLLAFLRGVFLFLVRQTLIVMSRLIEFDLKNEIYSKYQDLSLSFYRRNNTGDLMNRISEDVSRVRMFLGPAIMYGLNLVTLFLMVIPIMISVNPRLTLYVLLPLPILSMSIYYVNSIINDRSERIQEKLSSLSTFVQEAFSGIRVLKAFVREEDSIRKMSIESHEYRDTSLRLTFVESLFFPLILALIGLSTIITIYIGGLEVISGTITIGNIAEFVIYVNMLTWPVASLGWITSIVQRAAASQKRINEFLKIPSEIVSPTDKELTVSGHVEFKNVSFVYPDSGIQALEDVSFEVNAGETLAIVGTTGSGKSTIANLLTRMYDPTNGEVLVDGEDLKTINLQSYRSQLGYVPQDVFLFSDSIKKNISFGEKNISDENVESAARTADLYDNITEFPKGFETILGERGITLSGGQKQRVSIARALVRNPNMLIFDDCLSAVDTQTENSILTSLQAVTSHRTTIIISHRVSSTKLANKILVMDDGKIIERGTHDELMDKNGIYRELHDKQLTREEPSL